MITYVIGTDNDLAILYLHRYTAKDFAIGDDGITVLIQLVINQRFTEVKLETYRVHLKDRSGFPTYVRLDVRLIPRRVLIIDYNILTID